MSYTSNLYVANFQLQDALSINNGQTASAALAQRMMANQHWLMFTNAPTFSFIHSLIAGAATIRADVEMNAFSEYASFYFLAARDHTTVAAGGSGITVTAQTAGRVIGIPGYTTKGELGEAAWVSLEGDENTPGAQGIGKRPLMVYSASQDFHQLVEFTVDIEDGVYVYSAALRVIPNTKYAITFKG